MATGTISTLGVGSGLELQSILDQLKAVDKELITRKENEVTALGVQLNEFTVVNNLLLTMKSAALDLSLSSTYFNRTVTSSDESVATATVISGTAEQSGSVSVERLASKSAWLASGMSEKDSLVNTVEGLFRYSLGGAEVSVTVPADTKLSDLADLINSDQNNAGVTAKVIDTGSGSERYQLMLQADAPGSTNSISIAEIPDLMAMQRQEANAEALDAKLVVDNVTYYRGSNTVDDVMPGVTLNFQKIGDVSIAVASDNSGLAEKITSFVTAYNDVVQEISNNTKYDSEKGSFGILARTTLRDLPYALQNLMTKSVDADSAKKVTTFFDLGLEFNRDGTISINQDVLSAAIAATPDSISAFFTGDQEKGISGFADTVNDYLREATGGSGQIAAEKTGAQTRIDDLNLSIEAQTQRLDKRYEILTKQFVELDRYMSQMKSMGNYLTGQFDSLSNMLSGSSNK
ncbi:MAG: flagellar filament capping protein FliD [Desulfobulbaceae bacterium]|nr:flagellar filament capping protein FliD [Desulfobulbaceae bacterium]HIJ90240.1 flagellar filament capping protein FliD [Deltaproteobacteria bacterium]